MVAEFENICLSRGNKNIFSGFSFNINKNEKILIQGKSGIGKTTLFRILLGFQAVDSGKVRFNGLDINRENIRKIRARIFYLSQDIDLRKEIFKEIFEEIFSFNNVEYSDRLEEILCLLDLPHNIFDQNIKDFSGGERQRAGLLICFLLNRPVWLLDEPTSALDDKMKQKVADYILKCENNTAIIISHDEAWKKNDIIKIKRL
jgi:putative ABC transport system ATP-binding protein